MTAFETSQPRSLPPPFKGLMDRVPLAAVEYPYAEKIYNWNVSNGKCSLRKGDQYWGRATANNADPIVNLKSTNITGSEDDRLIGMVLINNGAGGINWYDYSTTTPSLMYSNGALALDNDIHTAEFNGYVYWWGHLGLSVVDGVYYSGSAWGTTPYTYSIGFVPFASTAHRSRHYIYELFSTKIAYGGVDAVTGTAKVMDIGSAFRNKCFIWGLRSISVTGTNGTDNLLAVIGSTGEIICYAGSYPESADWRIAARFKIPRPLVAEGLIDFNTDVLVITDGGLISIQDLFTQGERNAVENAMSAPIQNKWRRVARSLRGLGTTFPRWYTKGVYNEAEGKIVVHFPAFVDNTGATFSFGYQLIYDLATKAWYEHYNQTVGRHYPLEYHNGAIFYGSDTGNSVFKKEGKSDYKDDPRGGGTANPYAFELVSAPLPFAKAGVNRSVGMEFIASGDYTAVTDIKFISNLGGRSTAATRIPTQPAGIQKPFVSIGIEGTYIQYSLSSSGSTAPASTGCDLYGVNLVYQSGGLR